MEQGGHMQSALRITTKVLSGGKIELQLPLESVGDEVEVFVVLPEKPQPQKRSILEFFADVHLQGPFRTPEEIDRDIQMEKDAWDN
jgi:hypothetical protein